VPSLYIGNISIARNDTNSLIMSSPTAEQKSFIEQYISIFPNGFETNGVSNSFDNSNRGVKLIFGGPTGTEVVESFPH